MDPLSGLTSESRAVIDQFFRWSRLSADKFKQDLTVEAGAYQAGNLWRESYTKSEVAQMLQGQLAMLHGVAEAQVESTTSTAAELMRAVLREADLHRIPLTVDASAVLRDAGAVKAMGDHGQQLLRGGTGHLAPLTLAEAGGEAARQLAEANAEVRRLQVKLQQVTNAYTAVMQGRSSDTANLLSMQDAMDEKEKTALELLTRYQGQDPNLMAAVQALRSEVAEAKKDLASRLNQSTQYQQVKQLLAQRNQQLKTMRQQLAVYNPAYREQADDIAAEDD